MLTEKIKNFGCSIRHKILMGISLSLSGLGLLGAFSYYDLQQIESVMLLEEAVESLRGDVLEIRRFEKNLLLFADREPDRKELLRYTDQAITRCRAIYRAHVSLRFSGGYRQELREQLEDLFGRLSAYRGIAARARTEAALEALPSHGRVITETVLQFVHQLRRHTVDITETLRRQLLFSIIAALIAGLVLSYLIGQSILRSLGIIGQAAARIAAGEFKPFSVKNMELETRHVLEAMNHMLRELEKRQDQLTQEKKLASLGVLTSGIAHQLNNPLNNISTTCQLLREDITEVLSAGHDGEPQFPSLPAGSGENSRPLSLTVASGKASAAKSGSRQQSVTSIKTPEEDGGSDIRPHSACMRSAADTELPRDTEEGKKGQREDAAITKLLRGTAEGLDEIFKEVLRSRDIVRGLLDFARATPFRLVEMPLAPVVARAVQLVSSSTPAEVSIRTSVPEDLFLPLDARRMHEVLINLLLNSLAAIHIFPGEITITARAVPSENMAEITVCDTGEGIPPEALGRIFDPFFTLKEVGKGTGLGLSIVFGIVKKHGGTISVRSTEGKGTSFTLRLPLAERKPVADGADKADRHVPGHKPAHIRRKPEADGADEAGGDS